MKTEERYFAQFTDIHVGGNELAGEENLIAKMANPGQSLAEIPIRNLAEQHLVAAIEEVGNLVPQPSFVLVTGDLVSLGSERELRRYCELVQRSRIPLRATPSNHDLWGDGGKGWDRVMGQRRHRFDYAGIRFFLLDEFEPVPGGEVHQWRGRIRPEHFRWLRKGLKSWPASRPVILAFHVPILPFWKGLQPNVWEESAGELLEMLSEHNVLAVITGHIHRNGEWTLRTAGGKPIRVINTGALMGQQWTGNPPHYWFPTPPTRLPAFLHP